MRWNAPFVLSKCIIVASVVAKTGTTISCGTDGVSQAQEWWQHQPDGKAQLHARLRQVTPSSWRHVRQQTRQCHMEQLNRFRFRHRPLDYLAAEDALGANYLYGCIAPISRKALTRKAAIPLSFQGDGDRPTHPI